MANWECGSLFRAPGRHRLPTARGREKAGAAAWFSEDRSARLDWCFQDEKREKTTVF